MRIPNEYLPTLVQGPSVLDKLARELHVQVRALRVVGALSLVSHRSTPQVACLLGCHYDTAAKGVEEAVTSGWVLRRVGSARLQLSLAGLSLVENKLKRAEREARIGVEKPTLKARPRPYVKSGKFARKIDAGEIGVSAA